MTVRTKSRRRLTLLLVAAITAAAALGGGYGGIKYYKKEKARHAGIEGRAAFDRNDYAAALDKLGVYLGRFTPADRDYIVSLREYATARQAIPEADSSHIPAALNAWRKLADISPDEKTYRKLLELYPLFGRSYLTETLDTAAHLLKEVPNDPQALLSQASANYTLRKFTESRNAAKQLTDLDPLNIDGQSILMQLDRDRGDRPSDIRDRIKNLKVDQNDPRYLLLLSEAERMAGDLDAARQDAKAAAKAPSSDIAWLRRVVNQLDSLGLYDDSLVKCRELAANNQGDISYRIFWVTRLFQASAYKDVLDQLADVKPEDASASGVLLAIKVWTLLERNASPQDLADARAINNALLGRAQSDRNAFSLATAMRAAWYDQLGDSAAAPKIADRLNDIRQVAIGVPGYLAPYIRFLLAETLVQSGDAEAAVANYVEVAKDAPAWGQPYISLAKLFQGNPENMLAAATAARDRAPNDKDAQVYWLLASCQNPPRAPGTDPAAQAKAAAQYYGKLLKNPKAGEGQDPDFETAEARFPQAQELWPAHVSLLARLDRKNDAIAYLRRKLEQNPSNNILLAFAIVSETQKLGLEEECFAASEKVHGVTSELVAARARWMARPAEGDTPEVAQKKVDAALAWYKQQLGNHKEMSWRLPYARFLELCGDPAAKDTWTRLGDDFPGETLVQRQMILSSSVVADHALVWNVLERLRKAGDASIDTQIARAHWLLADAPSSPKKPEELSKFNDQVGEATKILNDVVRIAPGRDDARTDLARCMQLLGNTAGAADQLRAAAASGSSMRPMLELVRLELDRGNLEEARTQIARLWQPRERNGLPALPPPLPSDPAKLKEKLRGFGSNDLLFLAMTHANTGDLTHAALLLENDPAPSDAGRLLLARVYAGQGNIQKVEALLPQLLQQQNGESIGFVANFDNFLGRREEAEAALAALDKVKMQPEARAAIRADYYAGAGEPAKALEQFIAATRAAPSDARTWRRLVAFSFAQARKKEFDDAIAGYSKALPRDPVSALISDENNLKLLRGSVGDAAARDLFTLVLQSDDKSPQLGEKDVSQVLSETFQAFSDARAALGINEKLARIEKLARDNPKVFAIQSFYIQNLASTGNHEKAIAVADVAMRTFPTLPYPAHLVYISQMALGRYADAVATTREWRARLGLNPIDADLAFAQASIAKGAPDDALNQLKPYMERADRAPDDRPAIIDLYCHALVAKGQASDAFARLDPLLTRTGASGERWREITLSIVPAIRDPKAAHVWLERVTALIPAEASTERGRLALTYAALNSVTHDPADLQQSFAIFDTLIGKPDADPLMIFQVGMLHEANKDLENAERIYRLLLTFNPESVPQGANLSEAQRAARIDAMKSVQARALNNLAMILMRSNRLDEAIQRINAAVALAPNDSNILDSQATILAEARQWDAAIKAIDTAIHQEMQTENPEWQITRLWILHRAGKTQEVKAAYAKVLSLDLSRLSPDSKERLASIPPQ
jgi:tetratricopeptide (TPR) repeat protein